MFIPLGRSVPAIILPRRVLVEEPLRLLLFLTDEAQKQSASRLDDPIAGVVGVLGSVQITKSLERPVWVPRY